MSDQEVTSQERAEFVRFWRQQREGIVDMVSAETLEYFDIYTASDNVGYEMGQLRPGKLGQWDLYFWLTDLEVGCPENEAILASGLTAAEVEEEKKREDLLEACVDPDNPEEVFNYRIMKEMTPEQLNAEIKRLENLCGY